MKKVKNVAIVLVVIFIIYVVYKYLSKLSNKKYIDLSDDKFFINYPSNAKEQKKIAFKDLPKSINDVSYSLGFWFFVEDWRYKYQELKHIINKGDNMSHQPTIYLDRKDNILKIKMDLVEGSPEVIDVKDIYMKQWNHIYMNVENSNVNIFLNGKLVKSHILRAEIHNNTSDIIINKLGGYNGLFTKFIYSNDIKDHDDIHKIYKRGPYSSLLSELFQFLKKLINKLINGLDVCNK